MTDFGHQRMNSLCKFLANDFVNFNPNAAADLYLVVYTLQLLYPSQSSSPLHKPSSSPAANPTIERRSSLTSSCRLGQDRLKSQSNGGVKTWPPFAGLGRSCNLKLDTVFFSSEAPNQTQISQSKLDRVVFAKLVMEPIDPGRSSVSVCVCMNTHTHAFTYICTQQPTTNDMKENHV